jgi:hypothetical protein
VFFVSHNHRENEGGDASDSASKYNLYEVCSDDFLKIGIDQMQ